MALEFFGANAGSPSGCSNGVYIPVSDLPGVNAGELADSETEPTKQAKALLATYLAIADSMPDGVLGLTAARGSVGAGLDVQNNTFTMVPTIYFDHSNGEMAPLPVPTEGTNNGVGGLAITDIFPNAVKVAADGAISGEGFVIPTGDLDDYGAPDHATLDPTADSRLWFLGLFQWVGVTDSIMLRAAAQESAIVAKNRSGTNATNLPPNATADTNPTTGLSASDVNKISVVQHNCTLSIQTIVNQMTQTLDVNVITT